MRRGKLSHVAILKRKAKAQDDGGQQVADTVVRQKVACSIESLSGREVEKARAIYPEATQKVECDADPLHPMKYGDWLEVPGPLGIRKLHIGHIDDELQNGYGDLTLLCGEEPQ